MNKFNHIRKNTLISSHRDTLILASHPYFTSTITQIHAHRLTSIPPPEIIRKPTIFSTFQGNES